MTARCGTPEYSVSLWMLPHFFCTDWAIHASTHMLPSSRQEIVHVSSYQSFWKSSTSVSKEIHNGNSHNVTVSSPGKSLSFSSEEKNNQDEDGKVKVPECQTYFRALFSTGLGSVRNFTRTPVLSQGHASMKACPGYTSYLC